MHGLDHIVDMQGSLKWTQTETNVFVFDHKQLNKIRLTNTFTY